MIILQAGLEVEEVVPRRKGGAFEDQMCLLLVLMIPGEVKENQ